MTVFNKIPATIVTGFLGAGKTTMIRHLLENAGGRRIALVINEFGDVGVDGEILKSCGVEACREEDIVELANGCICCTVADDFLPAIEALLKRSGDIDHILIETSGLALPKPLVQAFAWPEIRTATTVDGVLTVIAPSRGGLNQFVGTLGNWSASTLTAGDEGTSAPSDAKALPALPGAASVLVDGAVTEVVCGTSTGRLLELTSLGVSAPWAAFDLTQLAHLDGAVQGAAVLPGGPTALLVAVRGRIVVLRSVS